MMSALWNKLWRVCAIFAAISWLAGCITPAPQPTQVADDEEAARINTQLGAEYLTMGDLELANIKLERALRQDPELATAHWTYALLRARLGRPKQAEQHFRTAVELDPQDARAHNNFGVFLCDLGRLEAAQEQFERALDNPLYDQPETALTNAGVCALKSRDVDQAEKYFTRALNENSEFAPALYEMARLAYGRAEYLTTLDYLARYERLADATPSTLLLSAQTAAKLGDSQAAAAYGAALTRQYPDSHQAFQLQTQRNDL